MVSDDAEPESAWWRNTQLRYAAVRLMGWWSWADLSQSEIRDLAGRLRAMAIAGMNPIDLGMDLVMPYELCEDQTTKALYRALASGNSERAVDLMALLADELDAQSSVLS